MSDKCVNEVVRAVEQFKTRLLARTGKVKRSKKKSKTTMFDWLQMMGRNIPDQVMKSVQVGLARKGIVRVIKKKQINNSV